MWQGRACSSYEDTQLGHAETQMLHVTVLQTHDLPSKIILMVINDAQGPGLGC